MEYGSVLRELTSYAAVSGNEQKLSQHLMELFGKYCDSVETDPFYNVIGFLKGTGKKRKKIMITAHLDEIGFLVNGIDERGFIKFSNVGGIDSKIMLAQEVVVHGRKDITGIIGAKPPHLLKPEEARKAVKMEDLTIDTGMSGEEVKKLVSIGDMITFRTRSSELQNGKISAKTVDNRCGVTTLLGIMEEMAKIKFEPDVYFVATTQEELELTGVTVASYNLEPDMAIVIDACHGDMQDAPKEGTHTLGKGPAVGIGPNLHRKLTRKAMELAKDENIACQTDVEPGDSGTEAWATQISRKGIPTILLSIPVRYMHTAVETVNPADMKNTARLAARILSLPASEMEELLCC